VVSQINWIICPFAKNEKITKFTGKPGKYIKQLFIIYPLFKFLAHFENVEAIALLNKNFYV
jgi:hypothetical protein